MLAQDIGRYQIGQEIPLVLHCTIADVPDVPLRHPTVEIRKHGSATWTYFGQVAADEQGRFDGFFRMPLQLDARFSTGRYSAYYRWKDSASDERFEERTFDIIAGGDADGAVIALHAVERPHARYLIMQTDAGIIKKGTSPR